MLNEGNVRLDEPWLSFVVPQSWARIEGGDIIQPLLHRFDRMAERFGDFTVRCRAPWDCRRLTYPCSSSRHNCGGSYARHLRCDRSLLPLVGKPRRQITIADSMP